MPRDEHRGPKTGFTVTMDFELYERLFDASKDQRTSMNKLANAAIRQFLSEHSSRMEKSAENEALIVEELFQKDPTGSRKLWYDERLGEEATRRLELMCQSERARLASEQLMKESNGTD